MEKSFKGLFVILAVVIGVMMSQTAWSGITIRTRTQTAWLGSVNVVEIITVAGTVYKCEPGSSGLQVDTGEAIVSIYGMGPASYWESKDVDFPDVGDEVTIWVYEISFSDDTTKYVAQSVDLTGDGVADITLRDENGVPLWSQNGKRLRGVRGSR